MSVGHARAGVGRGGDLYVDGGWLPAGRGELVDVLDPSTELSITQVRMASAEDVDEAVHAARRALRDGPWPRLPVEARATILERAAEALEDRSEQLAELTAREVGIPRRSAIGHPLGAAQVARLTARALREVSFEYERSGPLGRSLVVRQPVGVVAAVIPWNGPLVHGMMKIAPPLAAGCAVVIKPPPETPLSGLALATCLADAGVPPGVVNVVPGGRDIGVHLVEHSDIDYVSFTGSTRAGEQIARTAAASFRRYHLELGGKSAAVIADDADLDAALPHLLEGGVGNNGQRCYNLTRVLVSRARHDEVVGRLAQAFAAARVGDAKDPETAVGPLISAAQRERVLDYVRLARSEGAEVVTGGDRPDLEDGYFVSPTVLSGVDNVMRVAQEEIFGPVTSVIAYDDLDHAVQIANDSRYGLSGAVFTRDAAVADRVAREVATGTITVNGFWLNMAAPFGGFKASGVGREFGPEGIEEYLESKAINLDPDLTAGS